MTTEEFKEKKRLASQAWREANRERHRAYTRGYRKANAVERYQKNREWATANPEKVLEYHRKSRAENPDSYREITRKYRNSHPGFSAHHCMQRRARRKGATGEITREEWKFIVQCFAGHCACCGVTGRLSLDHIIPLAKGGTHSVDNAQPLCIPCNSRKHTRTIDYRKTSPFYDRGFYEKRFA